MQQFQLGKPNSPGAAQRCRNLVRNRSALAAKFSSISVMLALLGALLATAPLGLAQKSANPNLLEPKVPQTPIPSGTRAMVDSDRDGIPDDSDPDPLIANYSALKWEVNSVSLDYDITHRVRVTGGTTSDHTSMK